MNVPAINSSVWYASCSKKYNNGSIALKHSEKNRKNIMINQVLDVNEALVAKILYDFDCQLGFQLRSAYKFFTAKFK